MRRFLPLMVLLTHLTLYGQIDQKKLDSLARSIDSSAKAHKAWEDSFSKVQDSIYHSAINDSKILAEQKAKTKEKQQVVLRIGIIVALLIAAVVVVLRRKKTKT